MKKCFICDKKNRTGNSRSHSNIATKRKFKANLQTKRIDGFKVKICTRCIKAMGKAEK